MKRLNILLFVACATLGLSCSTDADDNTSSSTAAISKLPVDARIARAQTLHQEESVAGSILANKEITIASELAKRVLSIHFNEGSYVHGGQLLYKLDQAEINARLKQVEAEVALATLTETRLARLLKSESIRQEEYDVAATKLQSLLAAQEILRVELDKTLIKAPFAGIVGITKAEAGSLVSPGQPLVTLQDHAVIKLAFAVPEKYLPLIKIGDQIDFSPAGTTERLPATISATESGVDSETRAITVHAVAPNRKGTLKPGMSAIVYFSTIDKNAQAITLPTESLIPSAQGYSVFAVRNGKAKITPVTIGDRNESEAVITAGVAHGDTIMVSNTLRAGDGTLVEVVTIK